jgi:hypothetical protein
MESIKPDSEKQELNIGCVIVIAFLPILLVAFGALKYFLSYDSKCGGMIESSFELSPDSRLPKWFDIPAGYKRKNLSMKVIYCGQARVIIMGPGMMNEILMDKTGEDKWHPLTEPYITGYGAIPYPRYTIITIDGEGEVFEHKEAGNILYISDEPAITSVLKQPNAK